MAVTEARAAWQRTVNRCLVQEDAKRAPKLASCPSTSMKEVDNAPQYAADVHDTERACFLPFNHSSSYSNLSPNSRWWLNLKSNYGYQGGLAGEHLLSLEEMRRSASFGNSTSNLSKLYGQSECEVQYVDDFTVEEAFLDYHDKMSTSVNKVDNAFDSNSIHDCHEPWWRNADKEELAFLVSQKSYDLLENCDLPHPQCTYVNDALLLVEEHLNPHDKKPLCESNKRPMPEMNANDKDSTKAQLLEALCHSQTRAREAELAAKRACAEKEHVVELIFRQASKLFAYKQWFHLLQLENIYFQKKKKKHRYGRGKRGGPRHGCGKYGLIFALGLSLVGVGVLLGWTIGWMFPSL